jgi:serine/threonine protein phosphatase 1
MKAANIWNLDTGAGYNGKLTIMDIKTKEYWQSDLVTELYKDKKGRN